MGGRRGEFSTTASGTKAMQMLPALHASTLTQVWGTARKCLVAESQPRATAEQCWTEVDLSVTFLRWPEHLCRHSYIARGI